MNESPVRLLRACVGLLATSALLLGIAAPAASATPAGATSGSGSAAGGPATIAGGGQGGSGRLPDDQLDEALRQITAAGMPGVFAEVRDGRETWRGASGVADVETGRPVQPGYRHRVGSITKTFVATALLQLAGERRLALDAPLGHYLSEFAVDGVTVRMLLNHTSGIGSYDRVVFADPNALEGHRWTSFDPRELIRIGLAMPPTNSPGAAWAYSNTNYLLAGLILERITGRPAAQEIDRRVIRPLGLRSTYFPGTAPRITGPHSKAYLPWYDGELRDFSVYNMSWAGAAGELVSTTADLDRFYRALLGGELLRPAELAQMRDTVPMDPAQPTYGEYGLGLYWQALPCGAAWGHDGQVFGHSTISWHSADGRRQLTIALNMTHYAPPTEPHPIPTALFGFIATALCGSEAAGSASARSAMQLPGPVTPAIGGPAIAAAPPALKQVTG